VAALVAKEKREAEPAYKPPPDADMTPRRVTDKETIRKLKAEFPQLELPVDTQEHKATHANYAGHRSAFSWGSVEAAAAAAEAVRAPPSAAAVALPSAPPVLPKSKVAAVAAALSSTTSEPAAASDAGKYSWGALPAEPSQRASGRQELTQALSTSPLPQPLSTSPLPQALSTSSLPPPPPQALSTSALPPYCERLGAVNVKFVLRRTSVGRPIVGIDARARSGRQRVTRVGRAAIPLPPRIVGSAVSW
jgi:hypothetical protein